MDVWVWVWVCWWWGLGGGADERGWEGGHVRAGRAWGATEGGMDGEGGWRG